MAKRKRQKERGNGLAGVVSLFIGEQLNEVDPLATRPTPADEPGAQLDPTLDLISQSFKHCDEYIEDPAQPECLRKFLDRARSPAHGRFGPGSEKPYPKLFATYQGEDWQGARPSVASSRIKSFGLVMSARPIASICCSPPESSSPR